MHLLIVRHAIAESREAFALTGLHDDERPLVPRGIRRMRRGARGLRRLVPALDILAASPLLRARQTAELIAPVYGGIMVERVEPLRPESSPDALRGWLRERDDADTAAIVGHEPHLSTLISWLLAGADDPFVELRKGGAALLELPRTAAPKSARIHFLLTAGQLRAIV